MRSVKSNSMRKLIFAVMLLLPCSLCALVQGDGIFNCTVYNQEYSIYMVINATDKNVVIPGQDFMGKMVGYIGDKKDSRKWLILDSEPASETSLKLQISNDEGSEDLEALLTHENDTLYKLKQLDGRTLKIARNGKWQKLPQTIMFTRKAQKR